MIEFSNADFDKLFQSQISCGTVLRFQGYRFPNGTFRDKYIVILNQNHDGNSYFLFTTSQVRHHHRSRPRRYLLIPRGSVTVFGLDTVIDTYFIADYPANDLKNLCYQVDPRRVEIVGTLPQEMVRQICKMIQNSDEISALKKKIVLEQMQ